MEYKRGKAEGDLRLVLPQKDVKVVCTSDWQGRFVDTKSLKVFENYLQDAKPDVYILNGDNVDFFEISKFAKDPTRKSTIYQEILFLQRIIEKHRAMLPNTEIIWIDGNHEYRLDRYLFERAPELADFPQIELKKLLDLDSMDIKHVPYNSVLEFRDWLFTHGDCASKKAGYTAHRMLDKYWKSGVSGHSHRASSVVKSNYAGTFEWIEGGCLCMLDGLGYAAHPDWVQGFTTIDFVKHIGHAQIVKLKDRTFYADGRYYSLS